MKANDCGERRVHCHNAGGLRNYPSGNRHGRRWQVRDDGRGHDRADRAREADERKSGDILVKTETGSAWQSFVEDMIEEDMLPAVKIGSDILGIKNDILMM